MLHQSGAGNDAQGLQGVNHEGGCPGWRMRCHDGLDRAGGGAGNDAHELQEVSQDVGVQGGAHCSLLSLYVSYILHGKDVVLNIFS